MVVELHGLRKGADRWEFVETLATMAPAVFAAKARDRKASWSLFDTNKQRRTMIAMESHGRKDPTPSIVKVHRHGQGAKGGLRARPSGALAAV